MTKILAGILGIVVIFMDHGSAGVAWYSDANWLKRRAIVIDETKIPGASDFTNFVALVQFTSDTTLDDAGNLQADGDDILFTASDGTTKLNHELVSVDNAAGSFVAWVQIPTLLAASNTTIYLYYKNSSATSQQNADATWDANYIGVWHLDANDTTPDDSSGTATTMGENGDPGEAQTGKIGSGVTVTDNSSWLTIPWGNTVNPTTTSITMCAWINRSSDTGTDEHVFAHCNTNSNRFYWRFRGGGTNDPVSGRVGSGDTSPATGNSTSTTATWYRGCLVADAAADTFYARVNATSIVNGTSQGTSNAFAANFTVGTCANGTADGFTGTLDEVQLATIARSNDWLDAEYNNQNNPAVGSWLVSITDENKP